MHCQTKMSPLANCRLHQLSQKPCLWYNRHLNYNDRIGAGTSTSCGFRVDKQIQFEVLARVNYPMLSALTRYVSTIPFALSPKCAVIRMYSKCRFLSGVTPVESQDNLNLKVGKNTEGTYCAKLQGN